MNIKRFIPSKKYFIAVAVSYSIEYALAVLAFDYYNLPAYLFMPVIAGLIFFTKFLFMKFWVFKEKEEGED